MAVPRLRFIRHWAPAAGRHQQAFNHARQVPPVESEEDAHVLRTNLLDAKACTASSMACHSGDEHFPFRMATEHLF